MPRGIRRNPPQHIWDIVKCPKCGYQYPAPMMRKTCVCCGTYMEPQRVTVTLRGEQIRIS